MNSLWVRYAIYSVALATLLSACGSTPSARDVPVGAKFSAKILDDGSKLFTYSSLLPVKPDAAALRRGYGGEPAEERAVDLAPANKRALQTMLQENGYCRDGYVLLELYEDRTDYVIRGECRDAASDADRAKYPQH